MNKFVKTMSNTSYKLKQKAGMAEKTVDQSFEDARTMLNGMMDNASDICKAYLKHAEALEGLVPAKQLNESYKLTLDQNTDINLDMQELFRLMSSIVVDYGDKKREVVATIQKYIADLQLVKEKVKKRDELLVSYDKHKDELSSLTAKAKENDKLDKEKLKTQQYKDLFDTQNRETIEAIHQLHESQQQNLSPAFLLIIASQLQFFERMASAYQSSSISIWSKHDKQ